MAILAFTLNAVSCQATWHEDSKSIEAEVILREGQTHAGVLVPFLKDFMQGRPKIIATTTGPGSFTTIRVQLAAAIGLKVGYEAQLFCPSTLDVLAFAFPGHVPAINSFRGDYFCWVENEFTCLREDELNGLDLPLCGDLGIPANNLSKHLVDYYLQHPNPEKCREAVPFYGRTPEYKKANYYK